MLSQEQRFQLVLALLREGVNSERLAKEVKLIEDTVFSGGGCTFMDALESLCKQHNVYFEQAVQYKTLTDGKN